MKRSAVLTFAVAVLAPACGPADEVEIQPLPPLEQISLEARAGLPEIAGTWRFAGWELAPDDSASLGLPLPQFGAIALETQKRDSLAGRYVVQGGAAPLYGEVRRDSVISLVGVFGPGDLRFLAGHLAADTVWVELSSLTEQDRWPTDARAAFVRAQVDSPFVRLRGALPPVAAVDTSVLTPPAGRAPPAGTLPPAGGAAVTTPRQAPLTAPAARPTTPATGGVTPPRTTPIPTPVRPAPRTDTATPTPPAQQPPQQEPDEEPEVDEAEAQPEPPPVPLLGEPAVPDSAL